jgi:pimeloyl-ACP methyl ester carboxylesterase
MYGEYLRTFTEDGIELQGFLCTPTTQTGKTAVLHIHGTAGNFYENRFVDHIAETLASMGCAFLTINTRGHDIAATFLQRTATELKSVEIGSAYERFSDCLKDISAWLTILEESGYSNVVLEGHSLGTMKAVFYCSEIRDDRIKGLILMSPADSIGCQEKRLGDRFPVALQLAKQMIKEGREREWMPSDLFMYPVSAMTYAERFDPQTKRAMFNFAGTYRKSFEELARIRVPILAFLGTVNEAIVGESKAFLSQLSEVTKACPECKTAIIQGAPHSYLGHERKVAQLIEHWMRAHFD